MSNANLPAITHYTVADIELMASAVAQSRLFGMDAPQAMTLMLLAQSEGIHPMQAVKRYHVIQGRPALKADAMLADFQANGGTVEWTERSDKAWEGIFRHPIHAPKGETFRFTIEDARRADLLRNPTWTKYPGNMLRARVVSNAIRAIMPGVVAGIYTPEEVVDFAPLPTPPPRIDVETIRESRPAARRDPRSLAHLVSDGVDKTNAEVAKIRPDRNPVVNGFQVLRHLLKRAISLGRIDDPGKVKSGEVGEILGSYYETAEGYAWIRRELTEYLTDKLDGAREKIALESAEGGEVEAAGVVVEAREPGDEG